MVVYAKGPARPLSEVSFLLGRLAGQVLSRVRLVFAPELRSRALGQNGPTSRCGALDAVRPQGRPRDVSCESP